MPIENIIVEPPPVKRYEFFAYVCTVCNRVRYVTIQVPPWCLITEWCECELPKE